MKHRRWPSAALTRQQRAARPPEPPPARPPQTRRGTTAGRSGRPRTPRADPPECARPRRAGSTGSAPRSRPQEAARCPKCPCRAVRVSAASQQRIQRPLPTRTCHPAGRRRSRWPRAPRRCLRRRTASRRRRPPQRRRSGRRRRWPRTDRQPCSPAPQRINGSAAQRASGSARGGMPGLGGWRLCAGNTPSQPHRALGWLRAGCRRCGTACGAAACGAGAGWRARAVSKRLYSAFREPPTSPQSKILRGGTAASAMARAREGRQVLRFGGRFLRPPFARAPPLVLMPLAVSAPLVLSAGSGALKRSAARVAGSPAGAPLRMPACQLGRCRAAAADARPRCAGACRSALRAALSSAARIRGSSVAAPRAVIARRTVRAMATPVVAGASLPHREPTPMACARRGRGASRPAALPARRCGAH